MNRFDVVVIGGGLVGCATAYYLSKAGAKVILLERDDLNQEASGRNAGSLHFQLEYRLIKYGNELAEQFAQIIPLTLAAIDDWAGLEDELGTNLEVEMAGGLIVAETRADTESLDQRQALQERWGLPTTLLSAREVRRLAPYLSDSVVSAGFCAQEGHANPRMVTLAYAKRAMENGVSIQPNSSVSSIERVASAWHVIAESGNDVPTEVCADKVLNAAGAWSGDVAAMVHLHLPVYAVPLLMNVIERCRRVVPHLVQHARKRLTIKQVADGNILVGGGWPGRFSSTNARIDVGRRPEVIVQNAIGNLGLASRLIPEIRQLHLLRTWAGTTGITADQMPLLGEIPEAPGFYVAAGGAAFTHGPTYARLIGELMLGSHPSQSIEIYSPSRFSHVNNFMSAVQE
jgi:sarcosine oxidase subunit beta